MEAAEEIAVEVAFASPERQVVVSLIVPRGTTVRQAVELSGLLERVPEIDVRRNRLGVWGRVVSGERLLATGDRVEIYRPLRADPKEGRRRRARRGR